jgi:hypothetical protein
MQGSPQDSDVAESTRRVRRGCYATALILIALSAMLLSASQGNLFYLLLMVLAAAIFLFGRLVVR